MLKMRASEEKRGPQAQGYRASAGGKRMKLIFTVTNCVNSIYDYLTLARLNRRQEWSVGYARVSLERH